MEVFLIRHGQTDGNLAWRHQHANTRLNAAGKAQVEQLLTELEVMAPTHIVSSTNLRAVETTRAITEATGLIPDTSNLFEELRRPEHIIGRRFIGLETVRYILSWFYGAIFEDGESYSEFVDRLHAAQRYLEALPNDARVIVVSHSVFINMFVVHRCRKKPLSFPQAFWRFLRIMVHKNTGVTHLQYNAATTPGTCGWCLRSHPSATQEEA